MRDQTIESYELITQKLFLKQRKQFSNEGMQEIKIERVLGSKSSVSSSLRK